MDDGDEVQGADGDVGDMDVDVDAGDEVVNLIPVAPLPGGPVGAASRVIFLAMALGVQTMLVRNDSIRRHTTGYDYVCAVRDQATSCCFCHLCDNRLRGDWETALSRDLFGE